MSTNLREVQPGPNGQPPVIRKPSLPDEESNTLLRFIPAGLVSMVVHVVIILLFLLVNVTGQGGAAETEQARSTTFRQCAEVYIATHATGWRNVKHGKQWSSTLATYAYPVFGDLLSPAATDIELQTLRWIAEFIGYPNNCGGLFVSGGNMANFVCFLAARAAKAPCGHLSTG